MSVAVDASQIGWGVAGFLFVMTIALLWHRSTVKAEGKGWHERQHWETDKEIEGKLQRP
jgi:hypothetical protein